MNSSLAQRARNLSAFRALACFLPIIGAAQTISVDVRLVVLHASVRNHQGDIVSGLTQADFKIEEDGQIQSIRTFQAEDTPVAVGLVIDNSGSMINKRSDVTAAALEFARRSNPEDEMFIINFNEQVMLGLPDTKLFSASRSELEDAILKPLPAGKTALYDAISDALDHLHKSTKDRKVLVVVTDGGDNASHQTLKQVLQDIRRSDVTLYTIGLFDEDDEEGKPQVLRQIAAASGGEVFLPRGSSDAARICQQIATDIRTQYTLSYSPTNEKSDGKYRRIKVSATGSQGERLRVRTRPGYSSK